MKVFLGGLISMCIVFVILSLVVCNLLNNSVLLFVCYYYVDYKFLVNLEFEVIVLLSLVMLMKWK